MRLATAPYLASRVLTGIGESLRFMETLAGRAVSNEEVLARRVLPVEFMLNALRLREGFALADFSERTGLPPSTVEPVLEDARARGLVEFDEPAPGVRHVRPTARGFDFLSDLQALFVPPAR